MPMRNAAPFVEAAVRSVLAEVRIPLELIVVDDGSVDRSADVVSRVRDSRVRLLDGPRRGISACLNFGFETAQGRILMRCDADDLYPAGRIARQVEWLTTHEDYGAVCGGYSMVTQSGVAVAHFGAEDEREEDDVETEIRRGTLRTSLCTFAWRKHLFEAAGMFREYFESAEDLDFQFRLGERCRVRFRPGLEYLYRLHDRSITHRQAASRRIFFEETAGRFQRERYAVGLDALERGCPPEAPSQSLGKPTTAGEQAQGILIGRSWAELANGKRLSALGLSVLAISAAPFRKVGWTSIAKLLVRTVIAPRRM